MKKGYFAGVISEAKRVEWPKRKELVKMSLSVLAVSGLFVAVFFVMDALIAIVLKAMGL